MASPVDLAIHMLKPHAITAAIMSLVFALIFGPRFYQKITKGSWQSGFKNIALAILNSALLFLFFSGIAEFSKAFFYEGFQVPVSIWDNIYLPVTVLALVTLFDFANYWAHRILHTPLLWGIHTLHHSDQHMNWTTSYRIHALEYLVMVFSAGFIIGWLQVPTEAAATAGLIRSWYGNYVHSQLGWTHGRLAKVLASPNYHRWHHANVPAAYGKNLCDIFPIWDVMFGTYYNPGPCTADLGVDEAPDDIIAELIYPLVYWARGVKVHLNPRNFAVKSDHVRPANKDIPLSE